VVGERVFCKLQVGETFEVEVLRASPVKTTGVPKPDLIGCPQNDKYFYLGGLGKL
jgi:hypothetical protein